VAEIARSELEPSAWPCHAGRVRRHRRGPPARLGDDGALAPVEAFRRSRPGDWFTPRGCAGRAFDRPGPRRAAPRERPRRRHPSFRRRGTSWEPTIEIDATSTRPSRTDRTRRGVAAGAVGLAVSVDRERTGASNARACATYARAVAVADHVLITVSNGPRRAADHARRSSQGSAVSAASSGCRWFDRNIDRLARRPWSRGRVRHRRRRGSRRTTLANGDARPGSHHPAGGSLSGRSRAASHTRIRPNTVPARAIRVARPPTRRSAGASRFSVLDRQPGASEPGRQERGVGRGSGPNVRPERPGFRGHTGPDQPTDGVARNPAGGRPTSRSAVEVGSPSRSPRAQKSEHPVSNRTAAPAGI
jgi:hypothetical protein